MEEAMMTTVGFSFANPTTPLPSWKLYDNPFYSSRYSARKLAASLWDLASYPPMENGECFPARPRRRSEIDLARARIGDLEAEIEAERRLRRRAEVASKRLARELGEERKAREAMKRVCEELASEIAAEKAEKDRMREEMEQERKMLRLAEVWREERVQMKLKEARLLMEEKLAGLAKDEQTDLEAHHHPPPTEPGEKAEDAGMLAPELKMVVCENPASHDDASVPTGSRRRTSPGAENPHIKRGIKGFVEFPRVVRPAGSRGRQLGSTAQCQKAQLRLILRHRSSAAAAIAVAGSDTVLVG